MTGPCVAEIPVSEKSDFEIPGSELTVQRGGAKMRTEKPLRGCACGLTCPQCEAVVLVLFNPSLLHQAMLNMGTFPLDAPGPCPLCGTELLELNPASLSAVYRLIAEGVQESLAIAGKSNGESVPSAKSRA